MPARNPFAKITIITVFHAKVHDISMFLNPELKSLSSSPEIVYVSKISLQWPSARAGLVLILWLKSLVHCGHKYKIFQNIRVTAKQKIEEKKKKHPKTKMSSLTHIKPLLLKC